MSLMKLILSFLIATLALIQVHSFGVYTPVLSAPSAPVRILIGEPNCFSKMEFCMDLVLARHSHHRGRIHV